MAIEEIIQRAVDMYCVDEAGIGIDGQPPISEAPEGWWVQAWLWVPKDEQEMDA